MWGMVLIGLGAYAIWRGLTAKEFCMRGEDGAGREWRAPAWVGRPAHLLLGGLAIWRGISLLLR